jgi:hypothetical protein
MNITPVTRKMIVPSGNTYFSVRRSFSFRGVGAT